MLNNQEIHIYSQDDKGREQSQTQALAVLVFVEVPIQPGKSERSVLYTQQTLPYHSGPVKNVRHWLGKMQCSRTGQRYKLINAKDMEFLSQCFLSISTFGHSEILYMSKAERCSPLYTKCYIVELSTAFISFWSIVK